MSGKWYESFDCHVIIFSVKRGLSVFIRMPHNVGLVYDLGSSEEFDPGDIIAENISPYLAKYKDRHIAQCIISHPHVDHISAQKSFLEENSKLYPYLLTCPNDKEGEDCDPEQRIKFDRILNEDNSEAIERYRSYYEGRNCPLQILSSSCLPYNGVQGLECGIYYMKAMYVDIEHASDDCKYCNGLSILFYLSYGQQSILLTGDITPKVLNAILRDDHKKIEKRYHIYYEKNDINNPRDSHCRTSTQLSLGDLLRNRRLTVLLAPHHGLESGLSDELFDLMSEKPVINVISDKKKKSDSDGNIAKEYADGKYAEGCMVDDENIKIHRKMASTENDQHILIKLSGRTKIPSVYMRKDVEKLLSKM